MGTGRGEEAGIWGRGERARSTHFVGLGLHVEEGEDAQHVMISYNWDHQPVILRLVKALKARGYRIWVDVEALAGSTVDAMAQAVEGSIAMLLGVSRPYKESNNWCVIKSCTCRL